MEMDFATIVGFLGLGFILFAYARVQLRREYAKEMQYSFLNFLGALCLIYSLIINWNLASFASNVFWSLISLYGMYRCKKYRS